MPVEWLAACGAAFLGACPQFGFAKTTTKTDTNAAGTAWLLRVAPGASWQPFLAAEARLTLTSTPERRL